MIAPDAGDAVLHAGVTAGLWPGLVAAVGSGGVEQHRRVLGDAQRWGGPVRPMTADTVFDLASLTKVLATTPLVLLYARDGALALDDPVARYVPGADARLRVVDLLTHSSGLPAHVRFAARTPDELVTAAAAVTPEVGPGTRVVYSDVGFVLLGGVIGTVAGERLDAAFARIVAQPLGVGARFVPPAQWRARTAATEVYDGVATLGVVHDENAQTAGGVAGHAGLFGTLDDVVALLSLWQDGGPLLDDELRAAAFRDRTAGLGGHRGLGWTCRGDGFDILSPGWGAAAVSHTGFTGTSVALDPATGRWAVLLSNHVHAGRGRPEVFAARRGWHAALVGDA